MGKDSRGYKVKKDLRDLLVNRGDLLGITARVVNYILSGSVFEQLARLDEATQYLETSYWQNKETKPTSIVFLRALSDAIIKRDAITLFFTVAGSNDDIESRAVQIQTIMKQGRFTAQELLWSARNWFVVEFYRHIGENLECSVKFALAIFDSFNRTIREHVEGIGSTQKIHIRTAPYLVALKSASALPTEDMPSRNWLDQLIAHADDSAVSEVLESIVKVLTWQSPTDSVRLSFVKRLSATEAAPLTASSMLAGPDERIYSDPMLIIPEELSDSFKRWQKATADVNKRNNAEGERTLEEFRHWSTAVESDIRTKSSDILQNPPVRGFRPGGADHVEIQVSALRNAGLRSVVIHPEKCIFPCVDLQLIVRKETPHLLRYGGRIVVENGRLSLKVQKGALDNIAHPDTDELEFLLESVMVDILHRIITDKTWLRQSRKRRGILEALGLASRSAAVRPHYRDLRPGHCASDEARDEARREFGWPLPEGRTFVCAHYRGGELGYDIAEPLMIYRDSDFLAGGLR